MHTFPPTKSFLSFIPLPAITVYHFIPPSKLPRDGCHRVKSEMRNSHSHLIARPNRSCNGFLLSDIQSHWQHYQTDKSEHWEAFCVVYVRGGGYSVFNLAASGLPDICVIAQKQQKLKLRLCNMHFLPCFVVNELRYVPSNTDQNKRPHQNGIMKVLYKAVNMLQRVTVLNITLSSIGQESMEPW